MLVNKVWVTNKPSVKFFDLWANITPKIETVINELKNIKSGIMPSTMYNKGMEKSTLNIPPNMKHYYLVA